jgi:energy-coupling factor transporter ATP-binding protein EcfA2
MSLFSAHISLQKPGGPEKSVNFDLAAGETVYVAAPNGCGKSRAARQLCGLDHGERSNIKAAGQAFSVWRGKRLTELDGRMRAAKFGFVPPNPQLLFSMVGRTLRQELELAFGVLGRDVDDNAIDRMTDWFDLAPLLDRDYRQFSGGEQVRAALACVLVKGPEVVVTDQVADQIDPEFRRKVSAIFEDWAREDGGVLVQFATAMRDGFGNQARHCAFLTGQELLTGTSQECWPRLGQDGPILLGGPMRLGALLQQKGLAVFDSMPCEAEVLASALTPSSQYMTPFVTPPSGTGTDWLTARIYEFAYPGGAFHLRDAVLRVPAKTLCAVLGPNGAGKTTLLKCLANLVGPWKGAVSINGRDYDTKLSLPKTARLALYCFQNPDDQLYRSTVAEELVECSRNAGGSSALTSDDLQLAESFGLMAYLEASPFELPLSLRRLLVTASCLIARPPLLLLDEPTAWLDGQQKIALAGALSAFLRKGGCALAVSHDLDWVSTAASQLVFLANGRIVQRVESSVLPASQSLPYPPTCLEVAEHLAGFPRLWREEEFLRRLHHA